MDEAVRLLNNRTEDEVELDLLVNQVVPLPTTLVNVTLPRRPSSPDAPNLNSPS